MKITRIETITLGAFPNLLWVRIHTDQGLVGLGEAFVGAQTVASYIHETVAPYLLGKDARQIERHSRALYGYLGFKSTGVEARGNSAVDIALWDLFGRATGVPIYQLLGGASRDKIRVYNTCAGYRYVRSKPVQSIDNWGLPTGEGEGPYEDLNAFLYRADELAESLLAQGITGMKIWPFDFYAEASNGTYISAEELDTALDPFRKIRRALGNKMDIMVEFHSLWSLPMAKRLAHVLEEFDPFWFEDPVKMDNLGVLTELARSTRVPIAASETLGSRWAFRDLLETRAAGVVMFDLGWCGGFSEGKKIAGMAEAYSLPVTLHDCSGPVVLTASVHLSINTPNALIQEMVRAFYFGWYDELVTNLPRIENGFLYPPDGPGLGIDLLPDLPQRKDAQVRVTEV